MREAVDYLFQAGDRVEGLDTVSASSVGGKR